MVGLLHCPLGVRRDEIGYSDRDGGISAGGNGGTYLCAAEFQLLGRRGGRRVFEVGVFGGWRYYVVVLSVVVSHFSFRASMDDVK